MSATGVSVPQRDAPPGRRWVRRLVPLAFAAALGTAAFLTFHSSQSGHAARRPVANPGDSPAAKASAFDHSYPPDPAVPERPKVNGLAPLIPTANVVRGHVQVTSLQQLAALLPVGVLDRIAPGRWLLSRPAAVEGPAAIAVRGHETLLIGPGALLEARRGGLLSLEGLRVTGVDAQRHTMARPAPSRGFLLAFEGGRLSLVHDRITDLGHLGDVAYGISLRQPGKGSQVVGCTITGNYFGVYTSHGVGVRIVGNHISRSVIYGIDPQIESRAVLVQGNVVDGSGVHGIILSARDQGVRVLDNTVRGSTLHGIVVYRGSDGNVVQGNHVIGNFDGIVVTDSSGNLIRGNVVTGSKRFGLRMSGISKGNRILGNTFDGGLVGAYVYGGASGNSLLGNRFSHDRENVRVRADAPGNRVAPVPSRSELHS